LSISSFATPKKAEKLRKEKIDLLAATISRLAARVPEEAE
jgi:hypothetical protein